MGQIEDLRMFSLIIENRSISRAADHLNIAKSAVSRRLNLLEARYGTHLIDRSPGNWEVTDSGSELYQRAVRAVGEVDEIESDFSDAAQNLSGPLTISVPRDFGLAFLSPTLIDFKKKYPDIQLTVDFDDRTVDFQHENYDFAIRISLSIDDNVHYQKIGVSPHGLCASPEYLTQNGAPEKLGDLQNHDLLFYGSARRATWHFIDQKGNCQNLTFQPAINTNSGEFLLESTLNSVGVALLPKFISGPALATGALKQVLPAVATIERGIYLVNADNRRLNRRMRLFASEMKAVCLESVT